MGLLDRFARFTQDPRAQMLLGSLSRNIGGAPAGYLGAALGQSGAEFSDYLAQMEERRAQEEERRREMELEAEDRAMRRTSWQQNQEDRQLEAAARSAKAQSEIERRISLKQAVEDAGLPEGMRELADTEPDLVEDALKTHYLQEMKPKDPVKPAAWGQVAGGKHFSRTNPETGELEFTENPHWAPTPKEPKESDVTATEAASMKQLGFTDEEIDMVRLDSDLFDDIAKRRHPEMFGEEEAAEGSKPPTTAQILNEVQQLTGEGGAFWIKPNSPPADRERLTREALDFVNKQVEAIESRGKQPPPPFEGPPASPGLRRWNAERGGASPTPTPVGPDPADEFLLDEDGSLVARAIPSPTTTPTRNPARTASPSPTPTQVEAQRGGLRKQDPRETAGQTVGGIVLEDPAFAPAGDAVMTPVHHGGARRSEAVATVSASFQNTLAEAKKVLPKVRGEEGNKIIELAMRSLQEGLITEEELNELLKAEMGTAMATATATASPTASPTPTAMQPRASTMRAGSPQPAPTRTRTIQENAYQRQYGKPWER